MKYSENTPELAEQAEAKQTDRIGYQKANPTTTAPCLNPAVKKRILRENTKNPRSRWHQAVASCKAELSKPDRKISFELKSNDIYDYDVVNETATAEASLGRICSCCKPFDFHNDECRRRYEQAAHKGRRGVVLSLEIDQTTSYVTTLASDEHLKFRFQMPNSKHMR
eukprot:gene13714-15143_t